MKVLVEQAMLSQHREDLVRMLIGSEIEILQAQFDTRRRDIDGQLALAWHLMRYCVGPDREIIDELPIDHCMIEPFDGFTDAADGQSDESKIVDIDVVVHVQFFER